jgi:TorA maturation chaperone TorD
VSGEATTTESHRLEPEDQARADFYALLSRLFAAAPDAALLDALAGADEMVTAEAGSAIAEAWQRLCAAAAAMDPDAARQEYDDLFVGVGKSEVNLHASYYVAGFMMEKPLAELRGRLAAMGLAGRDSGVVVEDHLGALCEVMRVMITGHQRSGPASVAEQRQFFESEIAPWFERCCGAIDKSQVANFYRSVAEFATEFLRLEQEAFRIG